MKKMFAIVTSLTLVGCGSEPIEKQPPPAKEPLPVEAPQLIGDFSLLDQNDEWYELYYNADSPAIVFMAYDSRCEEMRQLAGGYQVLADSLVDTHMQFMLINTNPSDSRRELRSQLAEQEISIRALHDDTQYISKSLGMSRAGEIVVVDPEDWRVNYRGAIANEEFNWTVEILRELMIGKRPEPRFTQSVTCPLEFASRQMREDQYTAVIAPILQEKCVACHVKDGIGPWAMDSHLMVKGFAPMIREVLMTGRMPPWNVKTHTTALQRDFGLTMHQKRMLYQWIDAGAPRGAGLDPLLEQPNAKVEWELGPPDAIVEMEPFVVPATGVIDYQFPILENPFEEGKWIKAAVVVPSTPAVLHHMGMGTAKLHEHLGNTQDVYQNFVTGYVPGDGQTYLPDGTGIYLDPEQDFVMQMHYTPMGVEVTERTKIGFYFHDEPPAKIMRHASLDNHAIDVPAYDPDYTDRTYYHFYRDATIYMLRPHAHYRGKSMEFRVLLPDGTEYTLLTVPKYDFNWQHAYIFDEPVSVPAGSRLIYEVDYDNSPQNFANPDPTTSVQWGLQTLDEMMFSSILFVWDDETSENTVHDTVRAAVTEVFGYYDENMDGYIEPYETADVPTTALLLRMGRADTNNDGKVDIDELVNVFAERAES